MGRLYQGLRGRNNHAVQDAAKGRLPRHEGDRGTAEGSDLGKDQTDVEESYCVRGTATVSGWERGRTRHRSQGRARFELVY